MRFDFYTKTNEKPSPSAIFMCGINTRPGLIYIQKYTLCSTIGKNPSMNY